MRRFFISFGLRLFFDLPFLWLRLPVVPWCFLRACSAHHLLLCFSLGTCLWCRGLCVVSSFFCLLPYSVVGFSFLLLVSLFYVPCPFLGCLLCLILPAGGRFGEHMFSKLQLL